MSKKPNNKMIGLFIICAIGLFLGTIGMLISEKIFSSRENMVVMYFTESIKGLDVGSPVMFKGVTVGKVAKIDIITDLDDFDFSIPVYVSFNKKTINSKEADKEDKEILKELVKKGLRARLNTQNFLTGQLMIELEIFPDDVSAVYRQRGYSKVPEIPTVLSPIAQISRGMQDIPFKETFDKMNVFFESLNSEIIPELTELMAEFSKLPKSFDKMPNAMQSFNQTMTDISAAAKSMNNLTDYIERHPEAILKGKGKY